MTVQKRRVPLPPGGDAESSESYASPGTDYPPGRGPGERLDDVLVFRVADEGVKHALLADPSGAYFTTPHFDGRPAILVRISHLDRLSAEEVRELVTETSLCQAPKRLVKEWRTATAPDT